MPPADFLLERELLGTPPKSEKRRLLARRGSGEGVQPFLRKKTSEFEGEESAESNAESRADSTPLPFLVNWSR